MAMFSDRVEIHVDQLAELLGIDETAIVTDVRMCADGYVTITARSREPFKNGIQTAPGAHIDVRSPHMQRGVHL